MPGPGIFLLQWQEDGSAGEGACCISLMTWVLVLRPMKILERIKSLSCFLISIHKLQQMYIRVHITHKHTNTHTSQTPQYTTHSTHIPPHIHKAHTYHIHTKHIHYTHKPHIHHTHRYHTWTYITYHTYTTYTHKPHSHTDTHTNHAHTPHTQTYKRKHWC